MPCHNVVFLFHCFPVITVYCIFLLRILSTLNIRKVISLLGLDLIKSRSVWTTWFKLNHFLISWPLTMAHKRTRIYPAVRGSTTTFSSLNLRPNSKKCGSTWLVQLEILISVSRFEPVLNWNLLLAVHLRGLNSLNSASSGPWKTYYYLFKYLIYYLFKYLIYYLFKYFQDFRPWTFVVWPL